MPAPARIVSARLVSVAALLSLAACQQPAPDQPVSDQPASDRQVAAGTATPVPPPAGATPMPGDSGAPTPAPTDVASPAPSPAPTPARGANPTNADPYAGENDGYPDLTPMAKPGDGSETAARAVLLSWARGIELREFDQAWALMGPAAKAQISRAKFNAMFHDLHDLFVAVPGGTSEGAAGSTYYTVPTTIRGITLNGVKKRYKGEVILRRVNDVDGASPAQLTWHIEQVNLKPA